MILSFQEQFLKLKRTENTKSLVKSAFKSERKKKVSSLEKYQEPEKKIQGAKERYYRDPEPIKQYRKRKYQEHP